jgi:hypothetical protein
MGSMCEMCESSSPSIANCCLDVEISQYLNPSRKFYALETTNQPVLLEAADRQSPEGQAAPYWAAALNMWILGYPKSMD